MSEYSRPLGDTVRKARNRMGLTQNQVAALINADDRTIMNIECSKAETEPATLRIRGSSLCVSQLPYLHTVIFSFTTLISVSFLHFGQKSGKLIITVSSFTFVRVLQPQIVQGTHRESFI